MVRRIVKRKCNGRNDVNIFVKLQMNDFTGL